MQIPPPKPVILVTGANGQLGQDIRTIAGEQNEFEYLFTSRETMDITKFDDIDIICKKWRPSYLINCAAYTAVDKAEEEVDKARELNATAVAHLAKAANLYYFKIIHISTDYVYDSITDRPIKETDERIPKSIYGITKKEGEDILCNSSTDWITLRVSWLYSTFGKNFVKTMKRLGESKESLTVVADQIGTPTYARELALAIQDIITQDTKQGIKWQEAYNFSQAGHTNWAEFAREIMSLTGSVCTIEDTTTEAYGAPAPRPLWSVMSTDKITENLHISPKHWKEALRSCLLSMG